jgi:hypothetical protein
MAETQAPSPWLSGKTYDFLKFVAQVLLPALGTLYFAVAGVWGLPFADQVVGTVLAVDTFLGVILGISTAQYRASNALSAVNADVDGVMTIHQQDENAGMLQLEFADHPNVLTKKDRVTLEVKTLNTNSEAGGEHQDPSNQYAEPGNLPPVSPV